MNIEYDQRMSWKKLLPVLGEPGWLPHRRREGVGTAYLVTEQPFLTSGLPSLILYFLQFVQPVRPILMSLFNPTLSVDAGLKPGLLRCTHWRLVLITSRLHFIRSSRVVRESDSQCRSRNCPGFDLSVLRHSGIWGAADEAVMNKVHAKNPKISP